MALSSPPVLREPAPAPSALVIALAGFTALGIAMGIGRFAFTPILPMMQQEAALSVREGGWLASANYFGYLMGSLSAVALRVRTTTGIRAGLAVIALGTLGMGLAPGFTAWLILRMLAGVGSAWVLVFASAWTLGRLSAAGRPLLRGVVFAGVGTGITVAGILCVALMRGGAGSAIAWQGLGLIALVGTMGIWHALRSDPDGQTAHAEGSAGRVASAHQSRRTVPSYPWDFDSIRLVVCYGIFGFGYIIPATFVPAMARDLVKDPLVFGWSWPVFGMAAALSTLVAAAATRFVDNRRFWALSHLVMALGVSVPVVWPTIGGIMVAALLVGGTFMVNTMSGLQEARMVGGPHATGLMAAMTAAFATGQILGPLLVTYTVGPSDGFARPLVISSLLLAASAGALAAPRPAAG